MPSKYIRRTRLFPIGLSVNAAALSLQIERRKITAAMRAGHLEAYKNGTQVRILVESLVKWVREYWHRVS
jgi:excisionase family DNA binding protein